MARVSAGKRTKSGRALAVVAFAPIAGFATLSGIAAFAFVNGSGWTDGRGSDSWAIGTVLWALLGGSLLVLLVVTLQSPRGFGFRPIPPGALIAIATGNLVMAALGVPLASLAGYGRFPGAIVDTMLFAFITNGLLLCALAWIGSEGPHGGRAWLARGLASANGGIALALVALVAMAVLWPPVR